MLCRRCGHENAAGANYCSSCGAPLLADDTSVDPSLDGEPETTLSLALIEDRVALAAELGDLLVELPDGLGMLVGRRGPNAGSTFVLEDESTTLGRHPDSDIFLDDVTVSRRHATIERTPDGYVVSDGDSLNGTYVNHERIERTHLNDMNELQVGRFVLTFVLGGMEDER
jgi:hypothetical protein